MLDVQEVLKDPRKLPEDLRQVNYETLRTLYRTLNPIVKAWKHPPAKKDVGGPARVDTQFLMFSGARQRLAFELAERAVADHF